MARQAKGTMRRIRTVSFIKLSPATNDYVSMTSCRFAQKVKNSGRNGIGTRSGNERVSLCGRPAKRKTPNVVLGCTGKQNATAQVLISRQLLRVWCNARL